MPTKQEILDEIRRTAHENGGKPLGTALFEKETGIRPYDWQQYWPRLGDAQREAGYEPNQLQGAISDDEFVTQIIALTRKVGRIPTSREVAVEHRNNPQFLSKGAFERRGGKFKIAELVLAYCANHSGVDDVARVCEAVLDRSTDAISAKLNSQIELGEVYLAKSGRYYKIGRTIDTVRRGKELRIQLPEKMALIHTIKTDDPSGIEAYWHKRFEAKRMNGEWFDLKPADVQAFRRWRRIS